MQIDSKIKSTFKKIAFSLAIVTLLVYSNDIVTDESIWNWSRGLLLFILGLFLLVQITLLLWRVFSKSTYSKTLRTLALILWSPISFFILFLLLFSSTCEYRTRATSVFSEVEIRNTRVYIDSNEDGGVVGDGGRSVFQERPVVSSFYQVKDICSVRMYDEDIQFAIVDDYTIDCNENGKVRRVKLPF